MNKTLFIFVILVLNVADLVFPISAQAAEIQFLNATLKSTDASGCVSTEVFVFARSRSVGFQASSSQKVFIAISKIDDCKEVPLVRASGSATLIGQDLQLDPNLVSGTLDTTVKMRDSVSRRNFDARVNLAWAGFGALRTTRSKDHFDSPGIRVKEAKQFDMTNREAVVSGSISEGSTEFIQESTSEGEMALARRN